MIRLIVRFLLLAAVAAGFAWIADRPGTIVIRWLNRVVGRGMVKAAATENVPGEHVGVLNHVFEYVYKIRLAGMRIKKWNKPVYYLLKWALILGLLYLIFF